MTYDILTEGDNTRHRYTWSGLAEYVERASQTSSQEMSHTLGVGDANWCADSFPVVADYFAHGWREGAAKIADLAAVVYTQVTAHMPVLEPEWREAPDTCVLDMGRYCEGDPECWLEMAESDTFVAAPSSRTVRVVANLTASCVVEAKTIFIRGAATLALVDALERTGRSVELTAVHCVKKYGTILEQVLPLKRFGDLVSPDVLACALAHPGSLRRITFGVMEMCPAAVRTAIGIRNYEGYGRPSNNITATGDIVIPHVDAAHWNSPAAAVEWILETLADQGVQIIREGGQ